MSMQLGVIGLGTMGANLARNAARNGADVVVYNRTTSKMTEFVEEFGSEGNIMGKEDLQNFVQALQAPRAILLMVKAGPAVDAVLDELLPLLSEGDMVIDGGNSHYADTKARCARLKDQKMHFIGLGVSGGEEGALHGPSLMPGGDEQAYRQVEPLLTAIAAEDGIGGKCVTFLGEDGAGHFVKTVHNGIEYAVMQLLAESYDLLKNIGQLDNATLAETFTAWRSDDVLDSFLLDITADIFQQNDNEGEGLLLDNIKDAAGQKGTGKWTVEAAFDYGVAIPTISAAVEARIISGAADLRKKRQSFPEALDDQDPVLPPQKLISLVRSALKQSVILAYQQGFDLLQQAAKEEGWKYELAEIARIWRGGCIIRSSLLSYYQKAFGENAEQNLGSTEFLKAHFTEESQRNWRQAIKLGVAKGVPLPAMTASLSWYDAFRRERLPQSLIQAQRDYFGAHTYERTDRAGAFHTEWVTEAQS